MRDSIHHITLSTGHLATTPRSAVSREVIRALEPMVRNGGGPIPTCDDLSVDLYRPNVTKDGIYGWLDCRKSPLMATDGAAMFSVSQATRGIRKKAELVRCVACWRQDVSAAAWDSALDFDRVGDWPLPSPEVAPPSVVPWLSVSLRTAISEAPTAVVRMLGDFERCLAWTIIDLMAMAHAR